MTSAPHQTWCPHEITHGLETIRAFTRPIVTRRLDGPKRCTQTQVAGMPIIGVAHEAADLKVLAVPSLAR
jgi:hypothetical protein